MASRRVPGTEISADAAEVRPSWSPIAGGEEGENEEEDEELVKLATVDSEPLAEMFAEMLRNEGLTCVVKGGGTYSSALPLEVNEHYLFVLATELERAGELLSEFSDTKGAMTLGAPHALAARYGRRRREQESRGSRWR